MGDYSRPKLCLKRIDSLHLPFTRGSAQIIKKALKPAEIWLKGDWMQSEIISKKCLILMN
jgi:hypothetical protein